MHFVNDFPWHCSHCRVIERVQCADEEKLPFEIFHRDTFSISLAKCEVPWGIFRIVTV